MVYNPDEAPPGSRPPFEDLSKDGNDWVPMYSHGCTFGVDVFIDKMMNLIKNPNINSSWLYRADILYDDQCQVQIGEGDEASRPRVREIGDMARDRILVRTLVPRSTRRDAPLDQTCTFHTAHDSDGRVRSLVLYTPHISDPEEMPFYHPKVKAIAHHHVWDPTTNSGNISVHFLPYSQELLQDKKIQRTAYHLLQVLHKHGEGSASGYVKRVHHDLIVPQARFQDHYAAFKSKYSRVLISAWAEKTDPVKHVFEDLGIAAFLIELWADMYKSPDEFPGFVDIGCGNGLLVYILNQEGYKGWGFDARSRESWNKYGSSVSASPSGYSLEQRLLLPSLVAGEPEGGADELTETDQVHDGVFPTGTFIISNHADELTPWTPILAAASDCPFIMIPCCSHNLSGDKYRAPPPRDKTKPSSTYASLVDWVTQIAEECNWEVETEMLRIPSTRNTGLLGRKRGEKVVDLQAVICKYGGAKGYRANVEQLLKSGPRGH
ncbi:tRNASer (uridine44-2'-O)-methyltransferase [Geosmithia morbida]|uniref:tRNA (uracil-O(2)-)-methyltransferase n=1 Tax=Geosmithia morbida TaxID=1094350 RepID=A0A9P4YRS7_9HYPO|nr:tRNASer (uridine44-2'-O)-methyltransferase [Geosmithia morbida]KAF4119834.1 tRNASer (uridine44-2'-O)-methyltransferase [Geosmithia morbida]